MNLPLNINQQLHGKLAEWKRQEFDEEYTYFHMKLPIDGEVLKKSGKNSDMTPHVTLHVEKLLFILNNEMSRGKLMKVLGLDDKKIFRTLYLNYAIESSLVELTIPDKPNSSKQKYRLTNLGTLIKKATP